jgi:hypothetical protein
MPDELHIKMREAVVREVAHNMGVKPDEVPDEVQGAADAQVAGMLKENLQTLTREIARQQVRGELTQQVDPTEVVNKRLSGALKGLQEVRARPEAEGILRENAHLYKLKYDALVESGFSEEQSMQLLLAELARPKR